MPTARAHHSPHQHRGPAASGAGLMPNLGPTLKANRQPGPPGPRRPDDSLGAARGVVLAVPLSLAVWALIILATMWGA